MIKYRVHEVAKDFKTSSKVIGGILSKYATEPKNHMTALEPLDLDIIFEYFTQQNEVKSFEEFFNAPKTESMNDASKADDIKKDESNKDLKPDGSSAQKTEQPVRDDKIKKVRVVDTRGVSVDLAKFDERMENLVPDVTAKVLDADRNKQKIVKKNFNNRVQGRFGRPEGDMTKRVPQLQIKKQQIIVTLPPEISVGELASRLKAGGAEVVKKLMTFGIMASLSEIIDFDTASLIVEEFGAKVEKEVVVTIEDKLFDESEDDPGKLVKRSPVVVVMGHVDHGKTSLLDAIRHMNVTATEAGGITQHIGAYRVKIGEQEITFLDTPGHEAFTAMRARGAQVTDIAVLVVAADDGVMPQTVEAINHAKAAGVSIIVAVNKIDRQDADPDRVKQQLTEYGLVAEDWGGDTIFVPVSATKHIGIDTLLEMIVLVSEMKELKANPNRMAKGTVVESRLDKGRGPIATVLVQNGTLNVGDIIIAGTTVGRVRALIDDKGNRIAKAGPSIPAEVVGLSEVPTGGDLFYAVNDEKMARELADQRKYHIKEEQNESVPKLSLDDLFNQIKGGGIKDLNIIIKADVQGSVEALKQSLEKQSNEEVHVKCIHGGVGGINESDIMLASASNAIIVGFNVRPDAGAKSTADRQGVDIRLYSIIYEAIDEIQAAMKGMLAPKFKETLLGHAQVRQTFKVTGVGTIAGCYVLDGKIARSAKVRVLRDSIVVHDGEINSLKRFKDDAREVPTGFECGIGIERFNDLKDGDIIEAYVIEQIKE